MSKAKAKKLIPPIFFLFPDDIGLNFLLKTQVAFLPPSNMEFFYRAWGIEKSGIDSWRFKTIQNEAWVFTTTNRARIVRDGGVLVNLDYAYVSRNPKQMGKFVRQNVKVWDITRKNHFIPLDYGVDDFVEELAAIIKAYPNSYEKMSKQVEQLAQGIPAVGHTKPIAINAHGYLKFI